MSLTNAEIGLAVQEILQRITRIETRAVKFHQFMGWDPGTNKPSFHVGATAPYVALPSIHTSISEVLEVIPAGFKGTATIRHKGADLLRIQRP